MQSNNGARTTDSEVSVQSGSVVSQRVLIRDRRAPGSRFGQLGECARAAGPSRVTRHSTYEAAEFGSQRPSTVLQGLAFAARRANRELYRPWVKRAVDLVAGCVLLALLAPIIGVAWLAVRLTSRGGALFAQKRVGQHGKPITMYKLRSMYVDQHSRVDMKKINEDRANGLLYKTDDDPRVTPVGWLIRKTSIDELPQLWNVVRGDMSLVGPRPLVPYMLAPYPEIAARRSRVRPGITGLWQVSARADNRSVLGMAKYDIYYADNYSLAMDILILLKTPFVVMRAKGAQ